MSRFKIESAQRENLKARIAISAPSGSGKTTQALWMAEQLTGKKRNELDGSEILVIDTERNSASLYSRKPHEDVDNGTPFKRIDFTAPYSPLDLADLLDEYGSGFDVVIIDSLTHFWTGPGGVLEIADTPPAQGSKFTNGWRVATPQQDRMIASILNLPCHVICTMRAKTDRKIETDRNGKIKVRTLGMKAVQRDDVIYEFTIVLNIDKDSHRTTVEKTRMRSIDGHTFQTPGDIRKLGQTIQDWLDPDNAEAVQAANEMQSSIAQASQEAIDAAESLTEEDLESNRLGDGQLKQIGSVFNELAEGPERNSAKQEIENLMGDPRALNAGRFDTAIAAARDIVDARKTA